MLRLPLVQGAVHQLGQQPEELIGLGRIVDHPSAAILFSIQCINFCRILDSAILTATSDFPSRWASSRIELPEP
jgi:hypothetical protein